jgi:hypothetical protein
LSLKPRHSAGWRGLPPHAACQPGLHAQVLSAFGQDPRGSFSVPGTKRVARERPVGLVSIFLPTATTTVATPPYMYWPSEDHQLKTFSLNAIAELLERDRATVIRALRDTPADATERCQPRWKMATAVAALGQHNRNASGGGNIGGDIDPGLSAAFARFDTAYDEMKSLRSLTARRKASIALRPMISRMDQMLRAHGRAIGAGDELADLRADELWRLTMRGFESPCAWSLDQVLEQLGHLTHDPHSPQAT